MSFGLGIGMGQMPSDPLSLNISALFAQAAGRSGVSYTTENGGVSWDDLIAQNEAALAAGDPSRFQLFTDSTGTAPLLGPIGASKGLGLLLDRSQGLVRGPNVAIDGGFGDAGNWTTLSGATVSGGNLSWTGASAPIGQRAQAWEAGALYEVEFSISSLASGTVSAGLRNSINNAFLATSPAYSAPGTYRFFVQPDGTANILRFFGGASAQSATVDWFTVKKVPGNHAIQPTAAARGGFSRQYNTLLNSQLSGGGDSPTSWSRPTGTGVSAPLQTLADGSVVYHQSGVAADRPYLQSDVINNVLAGEVWRVRVEVYAVSGVVPANQVVSRAGTAVGTSQFRINGVVVADTDQVPSNSVVEMVLTVTAGGTAIFRAGPGSSGGMAGVFSVDFAKPDARLNADAISSIPAYQRVTSPTDYDEVGFPCYHRGQTDDGAFANIDPAGATKALILWAGQKMSDAAAGTLLGYRTSAVNGWFRVQGTSNAGLGRYGVGYRGDPGGTAGFLGTMPYQGFPAPNRNVLTVALDIGTAVQASQASIRVNGAVPATSNDAVAAGAVGAFSAGALTIGYEGAGSNFANDRTFGPPFLMFMQPGDAGLSASALARLEKKFLKAAGVA